jgi:hypothetical protein
VVVTARAIEVDDTNRRLMAGPAEGDRRFAQTPPLKLSPAFEEKLKFCEELFKGEGMCRSSLFMG